MRFQLDVHNVHVPVKAFPFRIEMTLTQYTDMALVLFGDPEIGLQMSKIHNFVWHCALRMVTFIRWPYQYIITGCGPILVSESAFC